MVAAGSMTLLLDGWRNDHRTSGLTRQREFVGCSGCDGLDVGWVDACSVGGEDSDGDGCVVGDAARDAGRGGRDVPVSPLHECEQRYAEVAAFLGELVLVALGPLLVADAFEDSVVDELLEPVGEDVAGDAETLLELLETAPAEERVADDQQRPALADELERPRDGAVLSFVVASQHGFRLAQLHDATDIC